MKIGAVLSSIGMRVLQYRDFASFQPCLCDCIGYSCRIMEKLEKMIRDAYAARGLTQLQLAHLSGVSQGQISNFLAGQRSLSAGNASRLCEALGIEFTIGKKPRTRPLPGKESPAVVTQAQKQELRRDA